MEILTKLKRSTLEGPLKSLPTSLRHALVRDGHTRLARFLEVLLKSEANLGVAYSAKALHQHFEGIYTQRGLQNLLNLFTKQYTIFSKVSVSRDNSVRKRGRPATLYHIPALEEIAEYFDEPILVESKPLSDADLASLRAYRMAIHRQQVQSGQRRWKKEDKYPSAAALAANLGVSKRTLWRYEREMPDLVRRRRFEDVPIRGSITPEDILRGAFEVWKGQTKVLRYPLPSMRQLVLGYEGV